MIRSSGTAQRNEPTWNRPLTWERMGVFYARVALGCAFLSAVADRFGLWGKYGGWGKFSNPMPHVTPGTPFMPPPFLPFPALAAPAAEHFFCVAVFLFVGPRPVALAAPTLPFFFLTATP